MKGLGTDIIEVDRIKKSIDRYGEKFLQKIFTKKEIEYCLKHKNSYIHFAGRFCAKESVAKAIGTGFNKDLNFLDIEIINDKSGKPKVFFKKEEKPNILISISHTKTIASAVAIVC